MPNIFKTGAFLQQCFSVHPLSLSFKMFMFPDKLGIFCQNCKIRHRLTISNISKMIGSSEMLTVGVADILRYCAENHQGMLQVTEVSVEFNAIKLRCRTCKASFQLTIMLYESYQP